MRVSRWICLTVAILATGSCTHLPPPSQQAPGGGYVVYVASESADLVTRLRFDGRDIIVERETPVGSFASEIDAPHGLAVSPDRRFVYVTLGHGRPYGSLWKMDVETDSVAGRTMLGNFPATVDLTPDGEYAFVANFNLHGDPVPSSVSKVHLPTMTEVARTTTCVMPHGSRLNPGGTRHYSVCMRDEILVEIDVESAGIARRFSMVPGREGAIPAGATPPARSAGGAGCSPTWAATSADGERVFVACNRSGEVLEIDVREWRIVRRLPTGEAPYNLEATPDGRFLLVTLRNRTTPAVEIIDLSTGALAGRVETSAALPHGIAITADSRYAFISVEGIGSEPGRVDVIDIAARSRLASVPVGQQATGIAVAR